MHYKRFISLGLVTTLSGLVVGCSLFQNSQSPSDSTSKWQEEQCQKLSWNEIISNLESPDPNQEAFANLFAYSQYCLLNDQEVSQLFELYGTTDQPALQEEILQSISIESIQNNPQLPEILEAIALEGEGYLAAIALRKLLDLEGGERSELWQTWRWPDPIKRILEDAVNDRLYLLSSLSYHELLELTERFPNSAFTQGCKEYAQLTFGPYFGATYGSSLRQPISPSEGLGRWMMFLETFPDHPASDDVMYRIGRSFELESAYEEAVVWYDRVSDVPDWELTSTAQLRILFIIDFLMADEDLHTFIQTYPDHLLTPAITYSTALRKLREGQLVEGRDELKTFVEKYRTSEFGSSNLGHSGSYSLRNFDSFNEERFWQAVQEQIGKIEELIAIQSNSSLSPDMVLYQEASVFYYDELILYNHLWLGNLTSYFVGAVPEDWDGINSFLQKSLTYETRNQALNAYTTQVGWLKSVQLFDQLVKQYPDSPRRADALYSMSLAYFFLAYNRLPGWTINGSQQPWQVRSLNGFRQFLVEFPDSSMADDALIAIASINLYLPQEDKNQATLQAIEALQSILQNYPDGDQQETAQEMLRNILEDS